MLLKTSLDFTLTSKKLMWLNWWDSDISSWRLGSIPSLSLNFFFTVRYWKFWWLKKPTFYSRSFKSLWELLVSWFQFFVCTLIWNMILWFLNKNLRFWFIVQFRTGREFIWPFSCSAELAPTRLTNYFLMGKLMA